VKERHGYKSGQWPYARVAPVLMIESDVSDEGQDRLLDIVAYVFSGKTVLIAAIEGEKTAYERAGLFSPSGVRLSAVGLSLIEKQPPTPLPEDFVLPVAAAEVTAYARTLADGCDHVRVDFMYAQGRLYFCEITVFPYGGYRFYSEPELLAQMASAWDLRDSWFLRTPQPGWRGRYATMLKGQLDMAEATDAARPRPPPA
jgi:hypothetical protein